MKRLMSALLLCASPAFAQANGWQEIQNGWGEIQTPPGYATLPAPASCTTPGQVGVFLGSPLALGCSTLSFNTATGALSTTRVLVGDGDAASPAIAPVSSPTSGIFFEATGTRISFGSVNAKVAGFLSTGLDITASTGAIRLGTSLNATIRRSATGEITIGSSLVLNDGVLQLNKVVRNSTSGAQASSGVSTELLTIAAAASTDTTANLLPADAYIEAVTVNVVTLIPTAATFMVGDATTAARFATGVAVAAGTKAVGLTHVDQTGAAGPKQTTAAKVRITPNASPAAATGVVRIDVFWRLYTAGAT